MRKNQIILIIVGIFVLVGFIIVFNLWFQSQEKGTEAGPTSEELEQLKTEEFENFELEHPEEAGTLPGSSAESVTSCDGILDVEGGISCQEAEEIALAEYPGEIYNIEKGGSAGNQFWVITIQQEENKTEVLIDMEGNIIRTNTY